MISPAQLSRLRSRCAAAIEKIFPITLVIGGHTIPAARWKSSASAEKELAGLLSESDVTWRIRREEIPTGLTIRPERTLIEESGITYRVDKVIDSNGDPCIVVEAKAV